MTVTGQIFPQDDAINLCREKIATLENQHKEELATRQLHERNARAILNEINSTKQELGLHLAAKMEEIERREKAAASPQPLPPGLAAMQAHKPDLAAAIGNAQDKLASEKAKRTSRRKAIDKKE